MCGSNPYEGQEFFLKIHIGSGAHSASFFSIDTVVQGVPCRAEDKNEWSYSFTPHMCLRSMGRDSTLRYSLLRSEY